MKKIIIVSAVLFLLDMAPMFQNDLKSAFASDQIEEEIGGLMIDRTLTRFGKNFYQSFSASWRTIRGSQKYSLSFIETPLPQSGTVLWVEHRGQKIYRTYFGRRHNSDHQQLIETAIKQVINAVTSMAAEQINPDLVGDGY